MDEKHEAEAENALSREDLEQALRRLVGVSVEPEELDRLHRRFLATKKGLNELESLVSTDLEPLPTVVLEDRRSESE